MSHRPIEQKQRRRVAKKLRKQPLDRYFDLVLWLVQHKHARTKREARQLIADKRVLANSHTIGLKEQWLPDKIGRMEFREDVWPFVPVSERSGIVVKSAP